LKKGQEDTKKDVEIVKKKVEGVRKGQRKLGDQMEEIKALLLGKVE